MQEKEARSSTVCGMDIPGGGVILSRSLIGRCGRDHFSSHTKWRFSFLQVGRQQPWPLKSTGWGCVERGLVEMKEALQGEAFRKPLSMHRDETSGTNASGVLNPAQPLAHLTITFTTNGFFNPPHVDNADISDYDFVLFLPTFSDTGALAPPDSGYDPTSINTAPFLHPLALNSLVLGCLFKSTFL
ncbi:hypothetical protein VP01_1804g1 [Puccinia sorghi]|uniref:Tet-like 2OG-Fe(II) oxygenase domain-containing protein n=1 Tax=Puccinia sorghi TaxID=27349 RepID=A0A0L6VET7_9BASI|nr:hypothetical protein VP01_1804g1 [Puccinia sorghi]